MKVSANSSVNRAANILISYLELKAERQQLFKHKYFIFFFI